MTTLIARAPLLPLSMSSTQRAPRRLSVRLAEKEDAPISGDVYNTVSTKNGTNHGISTRRVQDVAHPNNKKRKIDYDEEDDGFAFTRVKKQRSEAHSTQNIPVTDASTTEEHTRKGKSGQPIPENNATSEPPKRRRNKMSFSTPKPVTEEPSARRSKRLSTQTESRNSSPRPKTRRKPHTETETTREQAAEPPKPKNELLEKAVPATTPAATKDEQKDHSATKIALPFADTPVIRRNKAMREGKVAKGDRRSSLGLRGRRASSLIDSGTSNALPHGEVEVQSFYKHIDSESLPEPKRMRQLLTWCATRALGDKPSGTVFEDVSIKQAARIIQEELLKDFANQSEMSDWFGREDAPTPTVQIPQRPHPKNIQNAERIEELEVQVKMLRKERDSWESLLRPPALQSPPTNPPGRVESISNKTLLSTTDSALLASLTSSSAISSNISSRLNALSASLGPMVDSFADGIHQIGQYRSAAEDVAGRTLAICAAKLGERERQGRRRALQQDDMFSPKGSVDNVLRGLSRVDR